MVLLTKLVPIGRGFWQRRPVWFNWKESEYRKKPSKYWLKEILCSDEHFCNNESFIFTNINNITHDTEYELWESEVWFSILKCFFWTMKYDKMQSFIKTYAILFLQFLETTFRSKPTNCVMRMKVALNSA